MNFKRLPDAVIFHHGLDIFEDASEHAVIVAARIQVSVEFQVRIGRGQGEQVGKIEIEHLHGGKAKGFADKRLNGKGLALAVEQADRGRQAGGIGSGGPVPVKNGFAGIEQGGFLEKIKQIAVEENKTDVIAGLAQQRGILFQVQFDEFRREFALQALIFAGRQIDFGFQQIDQGIGFVAGQRGPGQMKAAGQSGGSSARAATAIAARQTNIMNHE